VQLSHCSEMSSEKIKDEDKRVTTEACGQDTQCWTLLNGAKLCVYVALRRDEAVASQGCPVDRQKMFSAHT
jgi:hypothetical protein